MHPESIEQIRLALVSGIGPRLRQVLLERFGTATGVFAADPSDLRKAPGIGPKLARQLARARDEIDIEGLLADCRAHEVTLFTPDDDAYPRLLRQIHDPPGVLFVRGELKPQDALAMAIVGSRHATSYGLAQAERLAGSLARAGFTIVSGLARGIDAAAHRGALAAGGRTLAVLGSGVLSIYPPEHRDLAAEVSRQGALISESPPHSPPLPGAFPQRNRIISGLSLGTIVVEAGLGSGALISARLALEQNREVFAVPGRIDSRMSHGCHRLIRDGAKLVETADDVLEELGPLATPAADASGRGVHHPAELLLNECEQRVLAAIDADGDAATVDSLVAATGLQVSQVLSTLTVLEMRRLARRAGGGAVRRIHH